jgi:hypothetical protein
MPHGDFKTVDTDTLYRAWIDRNDLLFMWEKKMRNTGVVDEGPVMGSQQEAWGGLKDLIATVRSFA